MPSEDLPPIKGIYVKQDAVFALHRCMVFGVCQYEMFRQIDAIYRDIQFLGDDAVNARQQDGVAFVGFQNLPHVGIWRAGVVACIAREDVDRKRVVWGKSVSE